MKKTMKIGVRGLARGFSKLRWWVQLPIIALAPLMLLNLSVAFFGSSTVFPLSPYFLGEKLRALREYAMHRPTCLFFGHSEFGPLVRAAEKRHKLPKGLMQAIVDVESGSRAHRISYAGAMGPAQLMPSTAELLGVSDPFEPSQAIEGGAKYLAQQLARTHDVRLAVAAYNAGPGNVRGSVPRNGQTEYYVAAVMERLARMPP